jgi:hypothetical protein
MTKVLTLEGLKDPQAVSAAAALEAGGLVHLPGHAFALEPEEAFLLSPEILEPKSKNASFDARSGRIGGVRLDGAAREALGGMMRRFASHADAVLAALAPGYGPFLEPGRTSFRPGAIETRALSPRKDDRRLHVDAFPANPVQGRRILRVFANVHPAGEARRWRVGEEDFETFARAFLPRVPVPRAAPWRAALGLTKGPRTAYDSAMLSLHDAGKADDAYQTRTPSTRLEFAPGSTWTVFTDGVLHAALAGQHALEQTYLLPVEAMVEEARSPLRILERLTGRALVSAA